MKIKGKQLEDTLRSESAPFDIVYADQTVGDLNGSVRFTALNNSGSTIGAYKVVYITGSSGNLPTIGLADADAASMPAFGLTTSSSNNGSEVDVVTFGNIKGVDTSTLSVGDVLYVSTTAGQYTVTPPTGNTTKLQNIGMVVKSDSNGIIKVGGAGRSNATPNLDQGHFFLGNGSNQSVQSAYELPLTVGTNGQVLASNGTNLDFQDASSGGFPLQIVANPATASANRSYYNTKASSFQAIFTLAATSGLSDGDTFVFSRKTAGDIVIRQSDYNASSPTARVEYFGSVAVSHTLTCNQQQIYVRYDSGGNKFYIFDKAQALVATTGDYDDLENLPTLGTASALDHGTGANNIVKLDANSKLPAVDGSQLTNLPSGGGYTYSAISANPTGGAEYSYHYSCTGTFTLVLPAVGPSDASKRIYVKNMGTGTITVDGNSSSTIDGEETIDLDVRYSSITLVATGNASASWEIV